MAAAALMLRDEPWLSQRTIRGGPLPVPEGPIGVAFLVSAGSNVIDMTGPWEVFQDVPRRPGFRLFTVAETAEPVRLTGGLQVIPDHTIDNAPQPHVIVVPAMRGTPRVLEWLKATSAKTDLTMSVCTGAFQLARAGLLNGQPATTHHDFFDAFARDFPGREAAARIPIRRDGAEPRDRRWAHVRHRPRPAHRRAVLRPSGGAADGRLHGIHRDRLDRVMLKENR